MAIDYNKISNDAVEEQLLKKESLEQLEDILMRCDTGGLPDKGIPIEEKRVLSKNELKETWPEVVSRVNSFLQVEDIKPPKVRYYTSREILSKNNSNKVIPALYSMGAVYIATIGVNNIMLGISNGAFSELAFGSLQMALVLLYKSISANMSANVNNEHPRLISSTYNLKGEKIKLKKEVETDLIPTIGHEYAHHLEHKILHTDYNTYSYFSEGFARGVERHISDLYAQERNDPRFVSDIVRATTGELSAVYFWMCSEQGDSLRSIPVFEKNNTILMAEHNMDKNLLPYKHAFGNTIFYLAEKRHGDGIYADALRGDVDFLFE